MNPLVEYSAVTAAAGVVAISPLIDVDELGIIKELTAFAALLLLVFFIGKSVVAKLGEVAPKLGGLQSAFEKGALEHKQALDKNTDAQERSTNTLQRLVETMQQATLATNASQAALADRNLGQTMAVLSKIQDSLAELKVEIARNQTLLQTILAARGHADRPQPGAGGQPAST